MSLFCYWKHWKAFTAGMAQGLQGYKKQHLYLIKDDEGFSEFLSCKLNISYVTKTSNVMAKNMTMRVLKCRETDNCYRFLAHGCWLVLF